MNNDAMNLLELAERANLNPRAVRYYIQRGLLTAPTGLGRGRHYNTSHLQTLQRIQELQSAGHSLDAIGKLLSGRAVEATPKSAPVRVRASLSSQLWTRLTVMTGVELHFDATRHQPDIEQLARLQAAIRAVFNEE